MKRRTAALLVLGCTLTLFTTGCSNTATVSGRVVGHTSGDPIAGAVVTASGETTQTDATGFFSLAGVSKATTKGSVAASGFPEAQVDLDFSNGDASATVEITDAAVTVSIKELAVEPQKITSATITLDGQPVVIGVPLENVAPGTRTLAVTVKDHEPYSAELVVVPGQSSVVASLSVTPLATYKRCWAAMQFHRDSVSYKYIHPDERKKMSLKKWKKLIADVEILSVKWGGVRNLSKWKSPVTKKTYQNVAEIDRTETLQVTGRQYSDYGKKYTNNFSQHWAKLNGIWYFLHKAI